MRVVIVGTGGVGGYFGGRLAQSGASVVFMARGAHLAAIREHGLRVESVAGDFVVHPAEATDDPTSVRDVDLALVCVKAWQVADIAPSLASMLQPDGVVVPLQNGVEAASELAAVVGAERILAGLCRILSHVAGPGHIRHGGVSPRIEIGELKGPPTERVAKLRALFERCVGVSITTPDDMARAIWEKFLFIAPVSGVGALTRSPIGRVRSIPETRAMLEAAVNEVYLVARAHGVKLDGDAVARIMHYVDALPAETTASMQRDIMEGRPSELAYQSGTVLRFGREHSVPVPVHECIYASLLPAELEARKG